MSVAICALLALVTFIPAGGNDSSSNAEGRTPETKKLAKESDELWHAGKVAESAKLLERIVKTDPGDIKAWKIVAWMHGYVIAKDAESDKARKEEEAKGIDLLRQGIKANPRSSVLTFELAWSLLDRIGDTESAIPYFKAASELATAKTQPTRDVCQRMLAHAYERLPDPEKAIQVYRQIQKDRPNDAMASDAIKSIEKQYLAAWQLVGKKKYQQALDALAPAIKQNSGCPVPRLLQAEIHRRSGNTRKAIAILTDMRRDPRAPKLVRFRIEQLERGEAKAKTRRA